MSNLPVIEVFLRADPLEAVVVSDPPVNVERPIFQSVNLDGALTDDDIGVTVQGFDADTVIDADYGDLKTKVGTIEEGAQVNPDLSVYAPKNNATFTGSLTLPNNSRINGVEHFYQTTKPTTRGDASALVIGDRWWKTDTGEEWFWNGTYWVSQIFTYDSTNVVATTAASFAANILIENAYPILLLGFAVRFTLAGTLTETNYWTISVIDTGGEVPTVVYDIQSGNSGETTGSILKTFTVNTYFPLSLPSAVLGFLLQRINSSSGTAGTYSLMAKYRLIFS